MKHIHWRLLGPALYWAWLSVSFFSPVLSVLGSPRDLENMNYWFWFALFALGCALVFLIGRNRLSTVRGNPLLFSLAPLMGTVGTVLIPFGLVLGTENNQFATVFCTVGSMLSGAASTLIALMWGEVYGKLEQRTALGYTIASYALLAFVHFLIVVLPPELGVLCSILLPAGSCLLLLEAKAKPSATTDSSPQAIERRHSAPFPQKRPHFSTSLFLPVMAIFVMGCCGEILHGLSTFPETAASTILMGNLYTIGGLAGTLLFAFVFTRCRQQRSVNRFISLLPVLMAIGLIVPTLVNCPFTVVYSIFGMTFWCFRIAIWYLCARAAHELDINPLAPFAAQFIAFDGAIIAGIPFGGLLTNAIAAAAFSWESVVLVIVACVFLLALTVFPHGQIASLWGLIPHETPAVPSEEKESGFEALLKQYGLTERECEVAELLAQGRNVPYIMEQLVISQGTANTHLRHIYEKMNVHNRQEFLDTLHS